MRASQLRGALLCTRRYLRVAASACALGLLLNACGGNDSADTSTNASLPVTISGADGASVSLRALPREAASQATVRVARDGTGAPLLGEGYTALGAVYQFTPLGWVEEVIEIRVPFANSEAGDAPHLLIAQPGGDWTEVADARVEGHFMVARVPQLAYATVATSTTPTSTSDRIRALGARITGTSSPSPLALGFDAEATTPALPAPDGNGIVTVASPTSLGLKLQYALPSGCKVAPVISVDAVVWNPITKKLKAVALGSRSVAGNTGSAAYTHPLSASDNGTWVFASLAYCKEPGRLLPRYAVLSAGPGLIVNIGTTTPTPPPAITSAPLDASVVEGAMASFSVTATGDALSYEWQRSNDGGATYAPVGAANAPSYSLTTALADNNALFRVKVGNANGSTTSTPAKLTVSQKVIAPTVTSDPANQTVIEGETASFSVSGSGQPAPTVQWQQRAVANADPEAGWADIAGATNTTYTTPATTLSQSGAQYRALLRNAGGVAATLPATLVVNAQVIAPAIVTAPQSLSVVAGQFGALAVTASGTSPLSYQWFKNGQAIAGANASEILVFADPVDAGASYQITVQVSNSAGSAASESATLSVTAVVDSTTSTLISATQGGVLSSPTGGVSLSVPPGAMLTDTLIDARSFTASTLVLPDGFTPLGDAFAITPSNLFFLTQATLSVPQPTNLSDGKAIALLQISDTSQALRQGLSAAISSSAVNTRRLAASTRKTTSALGPRTLASGGGYACIGPNGFRGGRIETLVTGGLTAVFGEVAANECLTTVPSPAYGVPSDTERPCATETEFAESNQNEATLVNRHVSCLKHTASESLVDALDSKGERVPYAGDFDLTMLSSTYGPSDTLSKNIAMQFRYRYTARANGEGVAAPTLKLLPVIRCSGGGSGPGGSCYKVLPIISLTAGANLTSPLTAEIPLVWDTTVDQQATYTFDVTFLWSTDGTTPRVEDLENASRINMPLTTEGLRCDVNQAKKNTKGCVFSGAAPVFVLDGLRDGVPASVSHIRDAQQNSAPGGFVLKEATRAIPANINLSFLQRTRTVSIIDANRSEARARCADLPRLPSDPPPIDQCEPVLDPDVPPVPCDCDEYPFATTLQGAASSQPFSVRRIDRSDNRRAGAMLGEFYRKQRVIDLESFWVQAR